MNIRLFDIFKSLFKWKYRIIAVIILSYFAARYYVGTIQSSSGQVILKYNDACISEGTFPDGSTFDQYQIASPEVLQNVINTLGLSDTVEALRRRITVSPIVPSSVQELQAAKAKDGEEYTYYPNTFMVSYYGSGNQPAYKIRELLETITFKYLDYYSEAYNEFAHINNALARGSIESFDYIESTEIMDDNVNEIISALEKYNGIDGGFRSTVTGYSFRDLIYEYEHLREFDIPKLYADIYAGKISKNPERLTELYMQRYNEAVLKQKNFEETAAMTKSKMDAFSAANKEVPNAYNYKRNDTNNDDLEILDNIHNNGVTKTTSKTTYDTLIENYANQSISANDALLEAQHCKKIADIFSGSTPKNVDTAALTGEIETTISTAADKMQKLYTSLSATISDYNDYSTQKHLSLLTGVKCYDNVSASLYEMVAIVLSGGFMVVLAIASEIVAIYKKENAAQEAAENAENSAE